jgi:uncharacterized membrane protein (UPF0136 family)
MSALTVSKHKVGLAFSVDLIAVAVAVFLAYELSEKNDVNQIRSAYITSAILLVLCLKLLYCAAVSVKFLLARKFVPFILMTTYLVLSAILIYGIFFFTMLLIGAVGTTLDGTEVGSYFVSRPQ